MEMTTGNICIINIDGEGKKKMMKYKNLLWNMILFAAIAGNAESLNLKWNLCREAKLSEGRFLKFSVSPENKSGQHCASAEFDLSSSADCMIEFSIRARAKNVSRPPREWNGVKFMLHCRDSAGKDFWPGIRKFSGTFDWQELSFFALVGKPQGKALLKLGLQDSSGEVEFDLASLRLHKLFSPPNRPFTARYSDEIRATPPLRGMMSPARNLTKDDFATLRSWNVNLVRAQITRNWHKVGTDRDLEEFDRWINRKLDHFETMFRIGYGQYGIRFVIDLHTYPGGRYANREMAMFHETRYAEYFVELWKKIALRFRNNPAVWGYGLINEPNQKRFAKHDFQTLQKQAAEAIRKIDPVRSIIFAANLSNSPDTFHLLQPVDLLNIIYEVHMYQPFQFTHQRVYSKDGKLRPGEKPVAYPGLINGEEFDQPKLRQILQPVRDFQLRYGARIYVGEFSAITWAPGAAQYLRDLIEIFEDYHWDWSYHAFREASVWDVEKAGPDRRNIRPAPDTDRKQVLLEGFRKNSR